MRILLVEDDRMIGESLQKGLAHNGYAIDWVRDAESAELGLSAHSYDLMLLDIGLPGKNGIVLLKELRQKKFTLPVLMLTARDSVTDKVVGLDAGADDYLVKPFDLGELEARIRALIRRHNGRSEPLMVAGNISLNPSTREISVGDCKALLSTREYVLMEALMARPGAVLSTSQLEDRLYGWRDEVESNTIAVHVYQLRKKLGKRCIMNVRGTGYKIGEA